MLAVAFIIVHFFLLCFIKIFLSSFVYRLRSTFEAAYNYHHFLLLLQLPLTLLATGCWLLAAGSWLLAAGCWLLAAGCWLLAAGCWLLLPPSSRSRPLISRLAASFSNVTFPTSYSQTYISMSTSKAACWMRETLRYFTFSISPACPLVVLTAPATRSCTLVPRYALTPSHGVAKSAGTLYTAAGFTHHNHCIAALTYVS